MNFLSNGQTVRDAIRLRKAGWKRRQKDKRVSYVSSNGVEVPSMHRALVLLDRYGPTPPWREGHLTLAPYRLHRPWARKRFSK